MANAQKSVKTTLQSLKVCSCNTSTFSLKHLVSVIDIWMSIFISVTLMRAIQDKTSNTTVFNKSSLRFQYTLMTELREIVAVEDRMRFDELVYRRDIESSHIRDPRDHDYRHSRVSEQLYSNLNIHQALCGSMQVALTTLNKLCFCRKLGVAQLKWKTRVVYLGNLLRHLFS